MGKPISLETFLSSLIFFTGPFDPGTSGIPVFLITVLAETLSPIILICSDLGPIKVILCSSKTLANL